MKRNDKSARKVSSPTPPAPRGRLIALAALAAAVAGWSVFLWRELAVSRRTGAEPTCAFGGDCGSLWDAPFASWIHAHSGIPVAGWGAVWGLVALTLPLLAARPGSDGRWAAATRYLGAAGLLAVGGLLAESVLAGLFCSSCAVAHGLTLGYGFLAWLGLPPPTPGAARRGLPAAAVGLVVAFVVLLFPGLRTPKAADRGGNAALAAATAGSAPAPAPAPGAPPPGDPAVPAASSPATLDSQERERRLEELITGLQSDARQALADTVDKWRKASPVDLGPPRHLDGPAEAPVRIVEFTDTLCTHCASLHATLEQLRSLVPPGSFAVDSRHYPLDGNCNRELPARGPETVRCLAARARICLESSPHADEYTRMLYGYQATLTEGDVFSLAEPFMPSRELSRCVGSAETAAKLRSDVAAVAQLDPHGTPVVVVNGKEGSPWAPFLYALVLAGGDLELPAFGWLPAPRPPQADDGHGH